MGINSEQRSKLTKELAGKFRKASGGGSIEHGVDQWELTMDALVKAIEGIIQAELAGGPPDAAQER